MEEQTNPNIEADNLDIELFLDEDHTDKEQTAVKAGSVAEGGNETAEKPEHGEAETISPEQIEQQAAEVPDYTDRLYKVKYNGRETKLTLSELVMHAQKGMNYDHVAAERDRYKNAPELLLLDRYAEQAGMKRDEYVRHLDKSIRESEISKITAAGVPSEIANELYEFRARESTLKAREAAEALQKSEADAKFAAIVEFHEAYPDVKNFPTEVQAEIAAGKTPLAAYQAHLLRRIGAELAAERKNKLNKSAVIGSVKDGAAPYQKDDFLSGWENA